MVIFDCMMKLVVFDIWKQFVQGILNGVFRMEGGLEMIELNEEEEV